MSYDVDGEIETLHGRRIIYVDMSRNREYWIGPYHQFNIIQQLLIEIFGRQRQIKFIKRSYETKEIKTLKELHKQISLYHTQETLHNGIVEQFEK